MTTPSQLNFISNLIIKNNIKNILDIGANIGNFAKMCKGISSDVNVTMIEGNPNCEESLKSISSQYYIALLSNNEREVDFYINQSNPVCTGASYYKEITTAYINPKKKKIKTVLLDKLLHNNETKFELIKIDVQGAELDVIRGGRNIISKASFVFCECPYVENENIPKYNENSCVLSEIADELKTLGFNNHQIVENLCVYSDSNFWEPGTVVAKDVLFYK